MFIVVKEFAPDHSLESGKTGSLNTLPASIMELTCAFMLQTPTWKLWERKWNCFFIKQLPLHSNWNRPQKEIHSLILNAEKVW